jgi:hypothetical protein
MGFHYLSEYCVDLPVIFISFICFQHCLSICGILYQVVEKYERWRKCLCECLCICVCVCVCVRVRACAIGPFSDGTK